MKRTLACAIPLSVAALSAGVSLAATAPSVTTGSATVVQPASATLTGSVNTHGLSGTYYFEYGKTTKYGLTTKKGSLAASNSTKAVASPVSGLHPQTTYHYRLVASTAGGTRTGSDRSFRTPAIPTQSTINLSANPLPFGQPLTVYGALIGPPASENAGKQVALEASVWPFKSGFQQVGNTELTDKNDGYVFTLAPPIYRIAYDTEFRVVDKSDLSVASPVTTVGVEPIVRLHAHRVRRARHRLHVRFFGSIAPAHNGLEVLIQRKLRHRRWRTVGRLHAGGKGGESAFGGVISLYHAGRYRAVVVISDGSGTSGVSETVRVR